ncbi:YebO family protein [Shimwellia blattae]|uniref:Uncharacterized protein YebO n=1 Tax=Shimwellia blattae (strain ATCC 29907 / DSM 4481 / JCM 1650 / NBRC 105725 / CDC 9005-74) TaxID=630626 RepID=I2B8J0_SHIBC|nr:YebO family protein [Shimwellia blattae]AFJ46844.1 hypothetical protein EBL_c17500 [Shimwellia blattae DSM 4481 = NBRC 105725]GAB82985.1 hypothetical protein YebO [Shimwellia blattae DSM 4481 = NBRC 105725]VDY64327.1 Uncharacterised protein [Shimwellia blattae]VEC22448.1 Uncharacterised protein [Shimwellia blattae]
MNDVTPGLFSLSALIVPFITLVVGLIAWFFVNRISVRANTQIALLEALLDQQKRQNALLRRLCEAQAPQVESPSRPAAVAGDDDEEDPSLVRLVAER